MTTPSTSNPRAQTAAAGLVATTFPPRLDIRVLGRLDVLADRAPVTPSAPKVRQVLALLAVHTDQVLPVSSLFRELWDDRLPRTALRTLQTYVGQLRKLIVTGTGLPAEVVTGQILVTEGRGYMLRSSAVALDLRTFDGLTQQGRRAVAVGDHAAAAARFASALELWQGPVLANVQAGPLLRAESARLEESRLSVVEQWIDAKLALHQYQDVLGDLTALVAQHPFNEGLHAQLMAVLHRCGRRAAALEVYRRLRMRLIDNLGLEPSARLQTLQRVILSGDHTPQPDLLLPASTAT